VTTRDLIDRVSPVPVRCDRCRQAADRELLTGVHVLPPDGDNRMWMLCEGCASFVDAAIAGRPAFSRGIGEHADGPYTDDVIGDEGGS
jgi:hypothetical protein